MLTPAARHVLRVSAQALELEKSSQVTSNKYQLMLAKLHSDMARLKEINAIGRRIELKKQLLKDYEAWVDGALASNSKAHDEVLATVFVWLFDCGDYDRGLQVAEHFVKHNLSLPDRFARDVKTFIADEIADAALKAQAKEQRFSAEYLYKVEALIDGADIVEQVMAKLYKAIANEENAEGHIEKALHYYQLADETYSKIGVKKMIKALEAKL